VVHDPAGILLFNYGKGLRYNQPCHGSSTGYVAICRDGTAHATAHTAAHTATHTTTYAATHIATHASSPFRSSGSIQLRCGF